MARHRPSLETLIDRFWESVEKTSDCWMWKKAITPESGYGAMRWDGPTRGAHCISWEIHYGPIPEGMSVLHHCDNRPCVRPDHLFLGTLDDNNKDMAAKGRRWAGKKVEFNGSSLTVKQWSARTGLSKTTILLRLQRGWTVQRTLETPRRIWRDEWNPVQRSNRST
jgi:hypothetical protein